MSYAVVEVIRPAAPAVADVVRGLQGPRGIQGLPGNNGVTITVGTSPPPDPEIGDLWVDTN